MGDQYEYLADVVFGEFVCNLARFVFCGQAKLVKARRFAAIAGQVVQPQYRNRQGIHAGKFGQPFLFQGADDQVCVGFGKLLIEFSERAGAGIHNADIGLAAVGAVVAVVGGQEAITDGFAGCGQLPVQRQCQYQVFRARCCQISQQGQFFRKHLRGRVAGPVILPLADQAPLGIQVNVRVLQGVGKFQPAFDFKAHGVICGLSELVRRGIFQVVPDFVMQLLRVRAAVGLGQQDQCQCRRQRLAGEGLGAGLERSGTGHGFVRIAQEVIGLAVGRQFGGPVGIFQFQGAGHGLQPVLVFQFRNWIGHLFTA